MATESTGAILAAAGANLAIAVAKFTGATLTGSAAMFSEGVHSVVDTSNQGLLLFGLHRAKRPADARHPFGYGREVYFYSFVVAILIFLAGGLYSFYEGIEKTLHPEAVRDATIFGVRLPGVAINIVVLGFSILAESYSFYAAFSALPGGRRAPLSTIRRSKDPSLFVVLAEDGAAVAGLLIALVGVSLSAALDLPALDGIASIGIGVLLVGVAFFLIVETHGLLVGEAADPDLVAAIEALAQAEPAVIGINEILTQHLGPSDILVNISLDARDDLRATDIEALVTRLDQTLRSRAPAVRRIFVEIQSPENSKRRPKPLAAGDAR